MLFIIIIIICFLCLVLCWHRLESAVPLLVKEIALLPDAIQSNLSIAYPDEGAYKRFHTLFEEDFPTILCTKVREGDCRIVSVKEGEE